MAADSEDILAVREWLSSEVKLERYADKLVTNGFISLKSCCKIDETVLDEVGIVLPYHRKRFLAFVEKLKEKLGTKLPNEANGVVSNTELIGQSEAGNEQQTSLICLKSDEGKSELENSCSSPLLKEDGGNSESTVAEEGLPMLPPKTAKRSPSVKAPPPIPPRADLQEGSSSRDSNPRAMHVNTQSHHSVQPSHAEQLPVHGDVPKRKVPQKPPRRTVEKAASANKPEVISGMSLESSLQTETQQQASCSVNNGVNEDVVATFDPLNCKELSTDVDNSLSAASELPHPQLSDGDLETCNDQTSRENYMLGEVDEGTGHTSLEAKRPAPKAAVRTGSKKPVPVPRVPRARVKSEDNILVSAVAPERNNIDEKKEEIPSAPKHSLQTRTKSFTTPGDRNVGPTEDKPSTFPRYPSRPAPPAPPRKTSLREKRSISDMPLPPIPTEGGNKNQGDELDGAVASGQGTVSLKFLRPRSDQNQFSPNNTKYNQEKTRLCNTLIT